MRRILTLAIAVVLAVSLAPAAAGKPQAKKAVHPDVDTSEACHSCHEGVTPEVVEEWQASDHGMMNVLCFVCHGSTGSDFRKKASADRCVGCHAEKVESMKTPFMKGKDCFSCHPPHALNPHPAAEAEGGEE